MNTLFFSQVKGFQIGGYRTAGIGSYIGAGGSITLDFTGSANGSINDLAGTSLVSGGSGGPPGYSFGGELTVPINNPGAKNSYTGSAGFSVGTLGEGHFFYTRTDIYSFPSVFPGFSPPQMENLPSKY